MGYRDPDGQFIHIVVGALVGGAAGGLTTAIMGGDLRQTTAAIIGGAVSGATFAAAAPVALAETVAAGAISNVAGTSLARGLNGQQVNANTILTDATVGGAGGAVGYGVGKVVSSLGSSNSLVCRGGTCGVDNFIKGSNEYKAGLDPGADTPLTGISVNTGGKTESLIKAGNLPRYGQFGQATKGDILNVGGKVDLSPTDKNPYHANINGLSANQLNKLFTPTNKNLFKK